MEITAETIARLDAPLLGAFDAEAIKQDPLLAQAAEHVVRTAEGMRALKPVHYEKEGKRLLAVSRTCLKRVLYLAAAYRIDGDAAHAARARDEMLAAAAFADWNPSHFLDVAEMTAALAVGYDWLHDALDGPARSSIAAAILEKGLQTSMAGGWWVKTHNNWNQVCHGGLVLGALALARQEPELARQIVQRAVDNLPKAMAEYAPHGAYPEGPTYWSYGTTYNVLLLAALEAAFGRDFGLGRAPGFMQSAEYYLRVNGPTGEFFNYSDCGLRGGVAPAMYWFAAKEGRADLLFNERGELQHFVEQAPRPDGQGDRFFPLLLLWAPRGADAAPPEGLHRRYDGRTPLGIHRSGWGAEDVFVALKGGSPGANHAHMDVGAFVVDAGGRRWAMDLGVQSYHGLESRGIALFDMKQESQRWDIFRLGSQSHNVLRVDGQQQRVDGDAPIVAHAETGARPHTVVDLSSVYAGQLRSARRGVALAADGAVWIQDEIVAPERAIEVRWAMVTPAEVEIAGPGRALLSQGRVSMELLAQPAAALEIHETAVPPNDFDEPNPGTRMVGFVVRLEAGAQETLAVRLAPAGLPAGEIIPLEAW